jgi:trehalose synthase
MHRTLVSKSKSLDDHIPIVGGGVVDELRRLAKPLKKLKVLNISVTAFGTGVAELLRSSVPLFCDLGLDCHWEVTRADEGFTYVNKAMYRALAGGQVEWSEEMTKVWEEYTAMNAELLRGQFDVIVVHDPQPAALRSYARKGRRREQWVLHSHIDAASAQGEVWGLLQPHILDYDALVFEDQAFLGQGTESSAVHFIAPAIDPLGTRNMEISDNAVEHLLNRLGIDPNRPLIAQIAPLSKESNALGAVEVFHLAREKIPGLQLVLVATASPQDPTAFSYFESVLRAAAEDPDVHVLPHPDHAGNVEINVVQRAAKAVIQRSLQRGFGIWISDALWKRTPVVAAPMGGVPKQVIDGKTGFLAESDDLFAERAVDLIQDGELARRLGSAGRQHVAENFLVCRYLGEYLRLLEGLVSSL